MSAAGARRLEDLMAYAVDHSTGHVSSGGLPFVGLVVAADGWVSDPGVNLVQETGDPTAHAEIVALRSAVQSRGASGVAGSTLLATGEPCALCYRAAAAHGVGSVCFAISRDTAASWGFDYRPAYDAYGTERLPLAATARHLPVPRGLEPFARYAALRRAGITTH